MKLAASVFVGLSMMPSDQLEWIPELDDVGEPAALVDLVDLVIRRLMVGDQLAAAKFWTGVPIVDPDQERTVLRSALSHAEHLGLDMRHATGFFQAQIMAGGIVQRHLLAVWTSRPVLAPVVWLDVEEVRNRLDLVDLDLGRSLLEVRQLASSELPLLIDLYRCRLRAADVHQLDKLHRTALSKALAPVVCRGATTRSR
jgi:chorismate mutase